MRYYAIETLTPITDNNGEVIADKLLVYLSDIEEYAALMSRVEYTAIETWMDYRAS